MNQALATAKQLAVANSDAVGAYEIRPIGIFRPGGETPR
jgi:hypothetical protein